MRSALAAVVATALTIALVVPDPFALLGFAGAETRDVVEGLFSDKVQHAVAYSVLAFALFFACSGSRLRVTLMGGGMAFAHGAATELLQTFLPRRTGDWKDLAADGLGVLIGAAAWNAPLLWAAARREPSLSPELPHS